MHTQRQRIVYHMFLNLQWGIDYSRLSFKLSIMPARFTLAGLDFHCKNWNNASASHINIRYYRDTQRLPAPVTARGALFYYGKKVKVSIVPREQCILNSFLECALTGRTTVKPRPQGPELYYIASQQPVDADNRINPPICDTNTSAHRPADRHGRGQSRYSQTALYHQPNSPHHPTSFLRRFSEAHPSCGK